MTPQELIAWDTDDGVVRLSGTDFLIVKSRGDRDGALATREQYESFSMNYAHVYADGRGVMRYGSRIADLSAVEAPLAAYETVSRGNEEPPELRPIRPFDESVDSDEEAV